MRYKKLAILLVSFVLSLAVPSAAFAVGGPNEAGNSGHFHPNSGPCVGHPDHPNCPGPH